MGTEFKERMLWQEILKRMQTASTVDMMGMLTTLKGMELNGKYPMKRFLHCVLTMRGGMPPWTKSGDTQYGLEVWLLTLGKEAEGDNVVGTVGDWVRKGEGLGEEAVCA